MVVRRRNLFMIHSSMNLNEEVEVMDKKNAIEIEHLEHVFIWQRILQMKQYWRPRAKK